MNKKIKKEQMTQVQNEFFRSALSLSIASILMGVSTKEKEIQNLEDVKKDFQRNIDMVNQGIETIKNLNIKEGFQNDRN